MPHCQQFFPVSPERMCCGKIGNFSIFPSLCLKCPAGFIQFCNEPYFSAVTSSLSIVHGYLLESAVPYCPDTGINLLTGVPLLSFHTIPDDKALLHAAREGIAWRRKVFRHEAIKTWREALAAVFPAYPILPAHSIIENHASAHKSFSPPKDRKIR